MDDGRSFDDRRRTTDDREEIVIVSTVVGRPWSVVKGSSVVSKVRLRAFLTRDRLWGAYGLGDLEPGLFEVCDWAIATADGQDIAVGLVFRPLDLIGCTLIGDAEGIRAILAQALRPDRAHFTILPEHRVVVETFYTLGEADEMLRMVVDEDSFMPRTLALESRPLPTPSPRKGGASSTPFPLREGGRGVGFQPRRVTLADLDRLNALYAGGETPDAFAPFQIEQGVFYAVERDGALVAAAGTHLVAPSEGVAAVGNVYTAQAWRGQGLAQVCTSAVVRECFGRGCRDVALNVNVSNRPAIAAYQKLGFRSHCHYLEVTGTRRR